MKKLIVAAVTAAAFMLTACGTAPIPAGTVVEKEIEFSKRKKRIPTVSCYEITVKDVDGKLHEGCVSKDVFDRLNIGDSWPKV